MDLGADGWQTFRFVTLPTISTALISGGLLAFALSFDEVIVTTFTAGAQNTLPIWIFGQIRLGQAAAAGERRRLRHPRVDDHPRRARPAPDARERDPAHRIGGTMTDKILIGGSGPASGETMEVLNPATEETIARVPRCGAEDVDAAVAARARRRCRSGSTRRRASARRLLLGLADVLEENAEELAEIESRNVGKPLVVRPRRDAGVRRQPALLRGRGARLLEGKSAGEYMRGYTSMIRREPLGVVGGIAPVELPADDGGVEARAGARGRQRAGAEAVGADAALAAAVRRARAGRAPGGRAERGHGRRRPGRRADRHASRRAARLADGRRRDREDHRAARPRTRSSACTSSSAARRRWSSSTTPTRRRSPRGSRSAATGTPARTAPPPRASSPARRSTTGCSRSSCRPSSRSGSAIPAEGEDIEMGPVISKAQQERVFGFLDRAKGATRAHGRRLERLARLLRAADRRHRRRSGRRDRPARGVRPGRDGAALRPDEPRRSPGRTTSVRTRRLGVDARRRRARSTRRASSSSGLSGSTTTSRSSRRCPTAATRAPATARISRCTRSRTTRRSST